MNWIAVLAACVRAEGPGAQPALPTVTLQVKGHAVTAEVADDETERERGLMHRSALAPDTGMLFVYPSERALGFWMKNTTIPLSIAYIDSAGRIGRIADMDPMSTRTVPSGGPARYALEMQQGWFALRGIGPGDTVVGLEAAHAPR